MEFKKLIHDAYPKKMSTLEFFILLHVGRQEGGCSQYDLAKAMSLQSSRVNPLVRKLVEEDLLVEHSIESNRNKMSISTTDKADTIVAEVIDTSHKKIDYVEGHNKEYGEMLDLLFKKLID
ncbi:MarR family transcriptional regulator [Vibrio kyushuensis]|uniref:MarR family transcriptional regulator n=1 Tax=Vibrio kyushuensis TaxID=2910249 RepID=UPI003D11AA6E